jgi:hypothetical protein
MGGADTSLTIESTMVIIFATDSRISELCIMFTLCVCVLYDFNNKQLLFP